MVNDTIEKGTEYIMKVLMEIKEDVASIKTDMSNLKTNSVKDFVGINTRLDKMEMQVKQNQENIDDLFEIVNSSEDKKDAKKYRAFTAYLLTAIGGVVIAKLPDIIKMLYILFATHK